MRRRFASPLLLVGIGTACVVVSAACSSSGSKGTPTATPTPFTPTDCVLVWENVNSSRIDAFEIDMPIANWTSGAKTCNTTSNRCGYVLGYDPGHGTVTAAGEATSGTFHVTVSTLVKGATVAFVDSDAQMYLDATVAAGAPLGAVVATGGTGSFNGVWSDPAAGTAPTIGQGTISVRVMGTAMVFGMAATPGGVAGSFGVCQNSNPAFAPLSPAERLTSYLQHLLTPELQ